MEFTTATAERSFDTKRGREGEGEGGDRIAVSRSKYEGRGGEYIGRRVIGSRLITRGKSTVNEEN